MTNAWPWWEKSKATVFPACNSWLNFRVRGQFEIKILIVRHINTTYFIWIKKNKLEPAIIWKLVTCQRITSKNTWPRWVDTWARDTVKWYWSADTLFWQLSIDHSIDVHLVFLSAPKLARKCESRHWFPCGADGRSAYGHVITKFSRMGRLPHFLTYGAPPTRSLCARVELCYKWTFTDFYQNSYCVFLQSPFHSFLVSVLN